MTDVPDLYALVLRLQAERGGPSPNPQGHGAQALVLDLLRQVAPELAEQLHADAVSKPYTVAVVPSGGRAPRGESAVELRVAFTRADLFPLVTRALLQQPPGATLRLGRASLVLADVFGTPESHPWAGYSSFAELWRGARAVPSVSLAFATPTAIGQGSRADGRQRLGLLPTPEAVFGSITRRWNELAPPPFWLDPAVVKQAADDTLVSRYLLETTLITLGKGPQKGFLGRCTYELPAEPSQAHLLTLLADAVFYLGVGMKTARGMGLCRRMKDEG